MPKLKINETLEESEARANLGINTSNLLKSNKLKISMSL